MTDETTLHPGSHTARRHGCTCSPIANQFGRGAFVSGGGEVQYVTHPACKLHGTEAAYVIHPQGDLASRAAIAPELRVMLNKNRRRGTPRTE